MQLATITHSACAWATNSVMKLGRLFNVSRNFLRHGIHWAVRLGDAKRIAFLTASSVSRQNLNFSSFQSRTSIKLRPIGALAYGEIWLLVSESGARNID